MNSTTVMTMAAIVIGLAALGLILYDVDEESSVPTVRDIYLFSKVDKNIDEEKFGIPPDQFSTEQIIVNKGDTVNVHFYNLEPVETQEHHTFTINGKPYNVDLDINAGESDIVTFTATKDGIFKYVCTYHEPTMVGNLIVLG
ncbi:MAG: nitrous oxide reductase [Cenarchaeum symbiont of Oopsacas minuta]|nr:nitrous oxide reductase [Cenarchaeum symbiont of Oopsacas minuta]